MPLHIDAEEAPGMSYFAPMLPTGPAAAAAARQTAGRARDGGAHQVGCR
jgi:hypothetical protein